MGSAVAGIVGLTRAWEPDRVDRTAMTQKDLKTIDFQSSLPPRLRNTVTAWKTLISANFAGDQACAACHEKEYQAHQRSGHSRTAIRMNESTFADRLAELTVVHDAQREQTFRFERTGDQLIVRDHNHAKGVSIPVTWLLGSGDHAQTPIAVDEFTQSGVEMRWSYYSGTDSIGITPDHEQFESFQPGTIDCFGRPMDAADIRSCLGCHSTITPPPSLPIMNELIVKNVGCERCHGPRKKHVELAHVGLAEDAKPLLTYETAESYMDSCATCHRDASSVDPDSTVSERARFQPYGIQRSRCYLETPGHLTCSTCHDPHDTVSKKRSESMDQCKRCHDQMIASGCAHQPQGDCIECHMPLVPWTAGIEFHDHWIRIPDETELSKRTSFRVDPHPTVTVSIE